MTVIDGWIKNKMNETMNSKGRVFWGKVNGEFAVKRKILDTRLTFGGAIQLTLNSPLPGKTSRLFTVDSGPILNEFVIVEK
jgi:hypothetical protein